MRKFVATLLLTAVCTYAGAQKNFVPGYIVLSGSDTLKGLLDYRAWGKNPTRIVFQASASAESKVYNSTELAAFGADGLDHYRKATVSIDRNPVRVSDVTGYRNELVVSETVLLRVLSRGSKLELYEYIDFKPHYFIAKPGGPVEELSYKVTQDNSSNIQFYYDFRNQLKQLLTSLGQLSYQQSQAIDKLDYKERDLVSFVSAINGISAASNGSGKNKSVIFAGAGIVLPNLSLYSKDQRFNAMKFDNPVSFVVTGGVDFYASRNRQNLLLRAELSLSQMKNNGVSETGNTSTGTQRNEYSIRQVNITPSLSVLYHFLQPGKAKFYAGIGAGYNFSTYPDHLLTITNPMSSPAVQQMEDYPILEKSWLAIYARLGVIVNEKIDIGVTGLVSGSFINYSYLEEKGVPLQFCVRYRFGQ